ncbi:MAG: prepilin-type N-terminal cleavage/methylation domain-containing protein [Colwellia sp.]|jgi:type IV pilus assembly protein PilE|nr:prepilin-type N-terminal cleavage/methylation domain-containing protein [Colwellia sp.]
MKKQLLNHGFSLIELLITVAIVGILAGVAYPSYTDYVLRSNRSEGQRELLRYANLQEQVFVDTRSYAANMKGLGESTEKIYTASKNYRIMVSAQTTTSFTLKAVAKNNQVNDTGCTPLQINHLGAKTPTACWEK